MNLFCNLCRGHAQTCPNYDIIVQCVYHKQDGFRNSTIENRINKDWDLVYFPLVRKHLPSLDNPRKQEMVENALTGYEKHVLHHVPTFKKGSFTMMLVDRI